MIHPWTALRFVNDQIGFGVAVDGRFRCTQAEQEGQAALRRFGDGARQRDIARVMAAPAAIEQAAFEPAWLEQKDREERQAIIIGHVADH